MRKSPLGQLELEVLRHIANGPPVTVGEVWEGFGSARSLARTTVQTVMERLCKKRFLVRLEDENVFRYAAKETQESISRGLIRDFIDRALAGSISPFVAYLTESEGISDEEFQELTKLVEKLKARQKETPK